MDEIASITESAIGIIAKCTAFFGFVLGVQVIVLLQLMGAVCKFAISLVGAVSILHVFSA